MFRRIACLVLAWLLVLSIGQGWAVPARADSLPVTQIAEQVLQAVEAGEESVFIHADTDNLEGFLTELFTRYPMLVYYYNGASGTSYSDHTEVTFSLRNTDTPLDTLWVIGSDEELTAALGLCLLAGQPELHFVTDNNYLISDDAVDLAIEQLHMQYPLAYMGYKGRSEHWNGYDGCNSRGYTVSIRYQYDLDSETLVQWKQESEQVVQDLMEHLIAQDMPDVRKVLEIHDWIIQNCVYNTSNMDEMGNHLAYGALVKGSCVCMGYAEAAIVLFQAAGLESRYIAGTGTDSNGVSGGHAWNAVKVDGQWYLLDMTWDDPVSADGTQTLRYDYFLVTDTQLAQDHAWDPTDAPVCNATAWTAERALAAQEQDLTDYTRYGESCYQTLAQTQDIFRQLLISATVLRQSLAPQEPPEPSVPQETQEQPSLPTQSPSQPTEQIRWTSPSDVPAESVPAETPESRGIGILWVILAGVVLVTAVAFTVVLLRQRAERRRRSRFRNPRSRNDSPRSYINWD